jgi:hypothetical protein
MYCGGNDHFRADCRIAPPSRGGRGDAVATTDEVANVEDVAASRSQDKTNTPSLLTSTRTSLAIMTSATDTRPGEAAVTIPAAEASRATPPPVHSTRTTYVRPTSSTTHRRRGGRTSTSSLISTKLSLRFRINLRSAFHNRGMSSARSATAVASTRTREKGIPHTKSRMGVERWSKGRDWALVPTDRRQR